jgi:5'-nucleotidase
LLDYSFDADFEPSKPFVRRIMQFVLDKGLSQTRLLNVNIPKLSSGEIKGMKVCRQANARWIEEFVESTDPRGQKYYWLTGQFINEDLCTDTDVYALDNGYISIVPSGHDLTSYSAMPGLSDLND